MSPLKTLALVASAVLLTLSPTLLPPFASAATLPTGDGSGSPGTDASGQDTTNTAGLPAFRDAVKTITPSVVNINTSRSIHADVIAPWSMSPFGRRQPLIVDPNGRPLQSPRMRQTLQQKSLGSGVIVSEDGYILTNSHVVQTADEISVTLSDGRSFAAEVVGLDPPTDVAVLKIGADDLLAAQLADSGAAEVGDWVLAVGNPFGLGHTVTSGIISAKGRTGVGVTHYEDFIQTDAVIHPGNSGGPLVDLAGRVVAINTAIASNSGSGMGVGFAIPANLARNVMDNLIQNGRMDRGWLGVYIQDLDAGLADSFGFDAKGVLVTQVISDGPGDRGGLLDGDIITHVDGEVMGSANTLSTTIGSLGNGRDVQLDVFRDGHMQRILVTIGRTGASAASEAPASLGVLGLGVRDLDQEVVRRHGLGVSQGAFVTEVDPAGLAARLGLRPGDVVLSVGDHDIADADDFYDAVARENLARGIRLLVESNGGRRYLMVRQSP